MDSISKSILEKSTIAPQKKSKLFWAISISIALILAGAGLRLVSRSKNIQPSIESLTVPTKTQSLDIKIEVSGSVQPIDSVNISPKSTSQLVALYVEQGDRVKGQQLLAKMDSANLQAELAQAEAELTQAQAEYTRVLNGNRNEAIARAQSQVNSAQARADLAATRVDKYRFLAQEGAVAQLTLDEYISEDRTARVVASISLNNFLKAMVLPSLPSYILIDA